jgi:PhnB protein
VQVQPYLYFNGHCQEAIDFYCRALGAEVQTLVHFKDSLALTSTPDGSEDKVMHACVRIGKIDMLMSDGQCGGTPMFQGFALSVSLPDDQAAERIFALLSNGGEVNVPLAKASNASSFGMVYDRFGVSWMILVKA